MHHCEHASYHFSLPNLAHRSSSFFAAKMSACYQLKQDSIYSARIIYSFYNDYKITYITYKIIKIR